MNARKLIIAAAKKLHVLKIVSRITLTVNKRILQQTFRIPLINGMGIQNLSLSDFWILDLIRRLRSIKKGSFIDIGVNIGQTLLKVKAIDKTIEYYGFEPNPYCVYYVKSLIARNNLEPAEIFPTGLWKDCDIKILLALHDTGTSASLIRELRPMMHAHAKRIAVPVFAFDEISFFENVPIGLVKIDVEGAELEVVQGFAKTIRRQRPTIICEILHPEKGSSLSRQADRNQEVYSFFIQNSYDIFRIVKDRGLDATVGLEPVQEFDLQYWSDETSPYLCDYLFVPNELIDEVTTLWP